VVNSLRKVIGHIGYLHVHALMRTDLLFTDRLQCDAAMCKVSQSYRITNCCR